MFSSAGQAQAFLATVYAGLAAGVAYDLLRLLRLSLKAGRVVTALLDLVFWVITAALVAVATALSGAKGLRLYLLLGAACGMLLWAAGLRQIMRGAGRLVLRALPKPQAGKRVRGGEITASTAQTDSPDASQVRPVAGVKPAPGEIPAATPPPGKKRRARGKKEAARVAQERSPAP